MALKWFLADEEDEDRALEVRSAIERGELRAVIPSHAHLEIASGLVRATRRHRLTKEAAIEALDAFGRFEIGILTAESVIAQSFSLAGSLGLSVHDAAFVAASDLLDAPLVTADKRLADKARRAGHEVVHLAELDL